MTPGTSQKDFMSRATIAESSLSLSNIYVPENWIACVGIKFMENDDKRSQLSDLLLNLFKLYYFLLLLFIESPKTLKRKHYDWICFIVSIILPLLERLCSCIFNNGTNNT
jgi:hypothetical protein